MPLLLLALLLCSCSPKQHEERDVHRFSDYSDMSAAYEAGLTPAASSQARPESGGGKMKASNLQNATKAFELHADGRMQDAGNVK